MRPSVRSTVEGVAVGLAAVFAMAVVAALGVQLALSGTGSGAGAGARARAGAAVVAMAVGAPVDVTVSGTAVPGSDRLPVRGGLPVTVAGTVDARPLGVTLVGVAVLVLLFRWRRLPWAGAAGALVGFVAGVEVLARIGRAGPVEVERVAVAFRAEVGPAVLGALVLAVLALGACLLPPVWRRPVASVAGVFGVLAALGTAVGLVIGAVAGGARTAGAALLAGADVLGAVPWALGVPWAVDVTGPLAGPLRDRLASEEPAGWRWVVAIGVLVCVLVARPRTTERGWPAAARLGAALAAGFAAVTVATGATATATATVFVIQLPAAEISFRGNVFVAVLVGAVAGTLAGLVPVPRVRRIRSRAA